MRRSSCWRKGNLEVSLGQQVQSVAFHVTRDGKFLFRGDPVDLSAFAGKPLDKATLVAATDVIMDAITDLLAGLQGIPRDLYEAAELDGARTWSSFRWVTWPMLGPTLVMVSILSMSGYFQLFAEPYVMTQGGPVQSTVSVLYFMYEEGFMWWNLGRASAVAFLLFLIILGVTTLLLRFGRRRELV